jgi:thermitase
LPLLFFSGICTVVPIKRNPFVLSMSRTLDTICSLSFQQAEQKAHALLTTKQLISNGELHRHCEEALALVTTVTHQRTRGTYSPAQAHYILSSLSANAAHLQGKLAEHLSYALQTYPSQLVAAGKSRTDAAAMLRMYEQQCIHAEQLLITIQSHAKRAYRSHGATQLLLGAPSQRSCDALVRSLEQSCIIERFSHIPYLAITTDDHTAASLLRGHRTLQDISVRTPGTYYVRPRREPAHQDYWNIELIGAPAAWKVTRGEGAKVAVIDTGIDYEHTDLKSRFNDITGIDFVDGDDPMDENGHGTHVAGTIAGVSTGVAPQATLYAVRVLDADGYGSEVGVLRGIEWAIQQQVHVINMSLGSAAGSDAEAKLVAIAAQKGIAVACAAGNDGDSSYNYPASHAGAISVAAIDEYKQHADFSNYNDRVALCAPGVSVYSTWPHNSYNVLSGTSMATPHVAGAAALLASIGKPVALLQQTALQLGARDYFGAGLIQLAEAVK